MMAACLFVEFCLCFSLVQGMPLLSSPQASIQGLLYMNLEYGEGEYSTTVALGTPPQTVKLVVDTGSSDLLILGSIYNESASSTSHSQREPFHAHFVDGTAALGRWVEDSITFPSGGTLQSVLFGCASESNATSILGIGMPFGESAFGNSTSPYHNLPLILKEQGLIRSSTYSIGLGSRKTGGGSLIFGGFDQSKFHPGSLVTLPMRNVFSTPAPPDIRVNLSRITLQNHTLSTTSGYTAVIDTGTSYLSLPQAVIESFALALNYTFDGTTGYFFGDCDSANIASSFSMLDFEITVPVSSLTMPAYEDPLGTKVAEVNGRPQCFLNMVEAYGPLDIILGSPLLRSLYMILDIENQEVGLAQSLDTESEPELTIIKSRINEI